MSTTVAGTDNISTWYYHSWSDAVGV